MELKISIITPSFNQAEFLTETLRSVTDQGYPNLEYLVIDGGSSDGSPEIIRKFENKIHYWCSEKDNGQSHAINKGLSAATGEIVGWLNSDDLLLPGTLRTVSKVFAENPGIDLVYGDVINFSDNGKEEYYGVKEFEPIDFISRNPIHQPSVFWRRNILANTSLLDESLHYMMDYDLWMRIFFKYKTKKVNVPLSKFRIHHHSKTSANPKEMYLEYRKAVSRFFNACPENKYQNILAELGIFIPEGPNKYEIDFSGLPLNKMASAYIHQCALQEYTWKNKQNANKLFRASLSYPSVIRNCIFLLKNNLG